MIISSQGQTEEDIPARGVSLEWVRSNGGQRDVRRAHGASGFGTDFSWMRIEGNAYKH